MSGQNTLITCANDNEIKRPSGVLISRQFYRNKASQGSGVYKAMDENGNIEIIGGPGFSNIIPFGNDTDVAPNNIQTTIIGASLSDDYTFEVRNLTDNTGAVTMQVNALGVKNVVDSDGNALVGGELKSTQIYLFAYNLTNDNYQLLGLAKPSPTPSLPDDIEVGSFALTGAEVTFTKTITTLRKAKQISIFGTRDAGSPVTLKEANSYGSGNVSVQSARFSYKDEVNNLFLYGMDMTRIFVVGRDLAGTGPDTGYNGKLTAINSTSFDILITALTNGGVACQFNWIALTGD